MKSLKHVFSRCLYKKGCEDEAEYGVVTKQAMTTSSDSEVDEVERSLELLDRVLSEFDDVENANTVGPPPRTGSSEDDGYMSLNGRRKSPLADTPPPPSAVEAQTIIANLLPRVSSSVGKTRPGRGLRALTLGHDTHSSDMSPAHTQTTVPKTRHQRPYGWQRDAVPPRTVAASTARHREVRRRSEERSRQPPRLPHVPPPPPDDLAALTELSDPDFSDDSLEGNRTVPQRGSIAWEVPLDDDEALYTPGSTKVIGRRRRRSTDRSSSGSCCGANEWPEPPTEGSASPASDCGVPIAGGTYVVRRPRQRRQLLINGTSEPNRSSSSEQEITTEVKSDGTFDDIKSLLREGLIEGLDEAPPSCPPPIPPPLKSNGEKETPSPVNGESSDVSPESPHSRAPPVTPSPSIDEPPNKCDIGIQCSPGEGTVVVIKDPVVIIPSKNYMNSMNGPRNSLESFKKNESRKDSVSSRRESCESKRETACSPLNTSESRKSSVSSRQGTGESRRSSSLRKDSEEIKEPTEVRKESWKKRQRDPLADALSTSDSECDRNQQPNRSTSITVLNTTDSSSNEALMRELKRVYAEDTICNNNSDASPSSPPLATAKVRDPDDPWYTAQEISQVQVIPVTESPEKAPKEFKVKVEVVPRGHEFGPLPPSPVQEQDEDTDSPAPPASSPVLTRPPSHGKRRQESFYRCSEPAGSDPVGTRLHGDHGPHGSLKTRSVDAGFTRSHRSHHSSSHRREGTGERRTLPTDLQPRNQNRAHHYSKHSIQVSASLPETPIFGRGADVPRTPHRNESGRGASGRSVSSGRQTPVPSSRQPPSGGRQASTAPRTTPQQPPGHPSGAATYRSTARYDEALAGVELLRLSGGPGRGWYPRQRRPASVENLDRWWPSTPVDGPGRKPHTLPPNVAPNFFRRSPRDALRRVTSLLIRKGNTKEKRDALSPTAGLAEAEGGRQKKGFFRSWWKRSRHYSLEQQ